MKKLLKKFSSIAAAAALTLAAFPAAGLNAAAEGEVLSSAEEGLLKYVNVVTGNVDYGKSVTRGELAHVAARVTNAEEYSSKDILFYDVTADHPYFSDIQALAKAGVISGDGNGYYRPDDTVTESDICKVFSSILGYREVGYFDSYLKIAVQEGIVDNVVLSDGVNYGELLKVAHNVLHCKMYDAVSVGSETGYSLSNEYAIERFHGLVPQKGLVEGCFGTTLTHPDDNIVEGKLVISGVRYSCENGDALLGYSVVFYTGRDGKEPDDNIHYIAADDKKNNVAVIDGEDVIGKTGGTLRYWKNDRESTMKVSETADVIYNGFAYPDYTAEDLRSGAGTLTLIDNDDDNVYDVISIDAVEFGVIKTIDDDNGIVYLRYPADKVIGDGREDTEIVYRRGEYKALPGSVTAGTAVGIKETKNKTGYKYITVQILETGSYGIVDRITDELITVNGATFEINSATVTDSDIAVSAGENVTVYTYNGFGAVILHPDNDVYKVGYLVNAKNEKAALSGTLKVQIIDTNRAVLELTAKEKLIVDGRTYNDDVNTVLSSLAATAAQTAKPDSNYPYAQLVRYRLNNNGQLTHLDTAVYNPDVEQDNSLQLSSENSGKTLGYNARNQAWFDGSNFAFTSGAASLGPVWMVPENARDESDWYHAGVEELNYKVDAYNFDDEYFTVDYVVAYYSKPEAADGVDVNRWAEIVTGVETTLTDDGEITKLLHTIAGGGTTRTHTLDPASSAIPDDLKVGDVIRVASNKTGSLVNIVQRFYKIGETPASRSFNSGNTNAFGVQDDRTYMAFGTGLYVNDGILGFTTSINDNRESCEERTNFFNFKLGSASVFVYDSENSKNRVTSASINDLITWEMNPATTDRVVLYARDGYLQFVFIVK